MTERMYNPGALFDALRDKLQLRDDAALARKLEIAPICIVRMRKWQMPIGASLMIQMHNVSGFSIRDLRDLMGDRRVKYRLADAQGRPAPRAAAQESGKQSAAPVGEKGSSHE